MKKFIVLFSGIFWVNYLFPQKINVYDSLIKYHLFEHLENENRANYFLDKKGFLKRTIYLSEDKTHYHRSHEDSLYAFLKKLMPEKFAGLKFFGGETVAWETTKRGNFGWKNGKEISPQQITRVFSSLQEMEKPLKRFKEFQKEEDAHFFYYHYYLNDTGSKTIYCFNSLSGKPNGILRHYETGRILTEDGFSRDGKLFFEVRENTLVIYYPPGKKAFEHNGNYIYGYSEVGETLWKYDLAQSRMIGIKPDVTTPSIHEYYSKIYDLWKKVMGI